MRQKNDYKVWVSIDWTSDKGVDIWQDLERMGVKLSIPPFYDDKPQFHENQVSKIQTTATPRIYNERAIALARSDDLQQLNANKLNENNTLWKTCIP